MRELSIERTKEVTGGESVILEFATTLAGATLGCAAAATALPTVNVFWFGLLPLPVSLAGAFVGGSIGRTLYHVEEITAMIALNHAEEMTAGMMPALSPSA